MHQNVDEVVTVILSENVNNEGCVNSLQNRKGNGIVHVRGKSNDGILPKIVDEDEPHYPRIHGRTENDVNLYCAENGNKGDLNPEISLPKDKIRTENGLIKKKMYSEEESSMSNNFLETIRIADKGGME